MFLKHLPLYAAGICRRPILLTQVYDPCQSQVSLCVFISRLCRFILRIHLTIAVTRILRQRSNSSGHDCSHKNSASEIEFFRFTLLCISVQNVPDRRIVSSPEHIQVIEELIQIVKIAPVFIPGTQIPELLIRFVERIRKASEQLRHSQIRLRVTIIHGGIDQPSLSPCTREGLSGSTRYLSRCDRRYSIFLLSDGPKYSAAASN